MDNVAEAIAAMNDLKREGVVADYALGGAMAFIPPDLMDRLREGKRELLRARIAMTLPEKIRQVVELQKVFVTVVGRRRPLEPHERVWPLE